MITENSALAALRHATQHVHRELEQDLHIASPGAGREEYLAYAAALWGWLSRFEHALWASAWPVEIQAVQRTGKCEWLRLDLLQGGLGNAAIDHLPLSGFQPDLRSMATRFGAAYVIEGAQLGTQVLRKRLGPTLAPWTPRWLEGYGADTAARWRAFISCMEHTLDSEASQAEAAHSAHETFSALATWFRMQSIA